MNASPFRNFIVLVGLISIGCGRSDRPETAYTEGTVMYNGNPVDKAVVSFMPVDAKVGRPATATTDANGKFVLTTFENGDGAIAGDYQVSVVKPAEMELTAEEEASPTLAMMRQQGGKVEKKKKSPIPEKYAVPNASGLQYTVQAGENNKFEINLTD